MNMNSRNRGVAFPIALMVLVICVALLAGGLRHASLHHQFHAQRRMAFQARMAAESGIAFVMATVERANGTQDLRALNGVQRQLNERQSFKIQVSLDHGFLRATSIGRYVNHEHRVTAMIGHRPDPMADSAILVRTASHEMYASGKVAVVGDIAVPGGSVRGQALHGLAAPPQKFVFGETRDSSQLNWAVPSPWSQQECVAILDNALTHLPQTASGPDLKLEGAALRLMGPIDISNWTVQGPGKLVIDGEVTAQQPLTIKSADLVLVGDAQMQTVALEGGRLLTDGSVKIVNGLQGYGEIWVRGRLTLGAKTAVSGPSIIGLLGEDRSKRESPLVVLEGGSMIGYAVVDAGLLKVADGASFSGYVYSRAAVVLDGAIHGHVRTETLTSQVGAQSFSNWFKGLALDRTGLQGMRALPLGMGSQAGVLSWVER